MTKHAAPRGLGPAAADLWESATEGFESIDAHERILLERACRTVDTIERLTAIADRGGLIVDSSQASRVHPAMTEMRQQETKLVKLMTALKLPFGEAPARVVVPQRKTKFEVLRDAR